MKKIFALALAAVMAVSMVACGGGEEETVTYDVNKIVETITADVPVSMATPVDEAYVEYLGTAYGLTEDMYEAVAGEYCQAMVSVDVLLAIQAKDGKAADVKAVMEAIKADKAASQENYLPAQYEKAMNARIVEKGNVVVLAILGDPIVVEDEGAEKAYEAVDAAIEKAFA